jgi:hypothetical protein
MIFNNLIAPSMKKKKIKIKITTTSNQNLLLPKRNHGMYRM